MVLRAVGRQFLDELNLVPIDSYSTLDAQVGYRWTHVEVYAAGMNLLDREYATNGFITPRSVISPGPGLPPTIMQYPAPPRAFRAGLRWRF
jgi:outer membrane receptor protein involved in Fe transport